VLVLLLGVLALGEVAVLVLLLHGASHRRRPRTYP